MPRIYLLPRVNGPKAHPFFKAVADEIGFVPRWNFNKVLVGPNGIVASTWGSNVRPMSRKIIKAFEAMLD